MEHPRLGVQPGGGGVVGDLDLGAEIDEGLESPGLGLTGVDRGDDPKLLARLDVAAQVGEEMTDPRPADERQDQVDPIGGIDLCFDLLPPRGWSRALVISTVSRSGVSGRRSESVSPVGATGSMAVRRSIGSTS